MARALLLLCLILTVQAYAGTCEGTFPDGTRPICSATFDLYQTCTNEDTVKRWSIIGPLGAYPAGQWQIRPWLDVDINIVRAEMVAQYQDNHLWYMLGNNSQGDPMLWLGAGEYHERTNYPPGTSWAFPSRSRAKDTDYIDVHGSCGAGKYQYMRVTFYYTIGPQ